MPTDPLSVLLADVLAARDDQPALTLALDVRDAVARLALVPAPTSPPPTMPSPALDALAAPTHADEPWPPTRRHPGRSILALVAIVLAALVALALVPASASADPQGPTTLAAGGAPGPGPSASSSEPNVGAPGPLTCYRTPAGDAALVAGRPLDASTDFVCIPDTPPTTTPPTGSDFGQPITWTRLTLNVGRLFMLVRVNWDAQQAGDARARSLGIDPDAPVPDAPR